MTVETRWSGVTVTDWLEGPVPNGDARPAADQGAAGCSTLVRVLSGSGVARLEFAPRPEFGQVPIKLQPLGDGLLVLGYNEPITLYAPGVEWDVFEDGGHDTARAVVDLSAAGGHVPLELRFDSHNVQPHPDSIEDRQARAEQPSLDWVARARAPRHRQEGRRPQRADPARPLPRADRLDPRCGDDGAPRGARRRAQLGLPLLLAA